jgi:NADPH:quinone reductase-like Zn-dependent oxidoreductase
MVVTTPDGPDALRLELQSRGEYQISVSPPFVSGGEVAGIVREAPPGSPFAVGDRVAGLTLWGGMAELALSSRSAFRSTR